MKRETGNEHYGQGIRWWRQLARGGSGAASGGSGGSGGSSGGTFHLPHPLVPILPHTFIPVVTAIPSPSATIGDPGVPCLQGYVWRQAYPGDYELPIDSDCASF